MLASSTVLHQSSLNHTLEKKNVMPHGVNWLSSFWQLASASLLNGDVRLASRD